MPIMVSYSMIRPMDGEMNLREQLSEAFSQQRDLTRSYRDAEERIVAMARDRLHLATTTDEAYEIWRDYSNSLLAEWLVVQSDDEIVREILEFIDRYAMRSRRFLSFVLSVCGSYPTITRRN